MAAARLTSEQELALAAVKACTPHATLRGLSYTLRRRPHAVARTLDALIRRGFITAVEAEYLGEVYIATVKGRSRVSH